jgi:tetratricopeptide (TPR) repeat protein
LGASAQIFANQQEAALASFLGLKALGQERNFNPAEILRNSLLVQKEAEVSEFLALLRKTGSSKPQWRKLEATAAAKAGRIDDAVALLKTLETENPDDGEVLLILGDLLYQKQDMTGASNYYDRYLEKVPDSPLREQLLRRKSSMR